MKKKIFFIFIVSVFVMLMYSVSVTAFAASNCANQKITVILGIAGEADIYCTEINDEAGIPAVQVDVQQMGKNLCRTLIQNSSVLKMCYAESWIYTKKDGTVSSYHYGYGMADARALSEYTFFNSFYGAKGNGWSDDCAESNEPKNHIGYWGDQSKFD